MRNRAESKFSLNLIKSKLIKRSVCVTIGLMIAMSLLVDSGQCKVKKEPIDGPETEALFQKLSQQPELMTLDYLGYVIGQPANNAFAGGWTSSKHYLWYQKNNQGLAYELFQECPTPDTITEATFIVYLTDLDLSLPDVEKKFGQAQKKYYDQQICPTEEFSFVPDTLLKFTQPRNLGRVSKVTVHYKGAPLPKPSPAEIEAASLSRKTQAMNHAKNGNWRQSIPLLQQHIAENPSDLEAQVALAQAYKSNNSLNAAINQYKYTLDQANAAGDQDAINACTQGLQQLRVLPSVEADRQELRHQYLLGKGGEGFHTGDVQERGAQLAPYAGTQAPQPTGTPDLLPQPAPPLQGMEVPGLPQTTPLQGLQAPGLQPFPAPQGLQAPGLQPVAPLQGLQGPNLQPLAPLQGVQAPGLQPFPAPQGLQAPGLQPVAPLQGPQDLVPRQSPAMGGFGPTGLDPNF